MTCLKLVPLFMGEDSREAAGGGSLARRSG